MKQLIITIYLMILVSNIAASQLQMDKTNYNENEKLTILLNSSIEQINMKIISPSNTYDFALLTSKMFFQPKVPGEYIIELLNKTTNQVISTTKFSVGKTFNKKFIMHDSHLRNIDSTIKIYNGQELLVSGKSSESISIENSISKVDIEVQPALKSLKKIYLMNVEVDSDLDLGLEDLNLPGFVKSYAIDPARINFSHAIVTSTAQARYLYKCAEWDFESQRCNGIWHKVIDLVPGTDYTFILAPEDPGYGESNEPPIPHTVTGFIYYQDNTTRVSNGLPVRITDNANLYSVLTLVYAPPVPQFAGAYAADIYGKDYDPITVYSYNSTHYGQTYSSLMPTTTRVNVSLQYKRKSETNVTILSPLNNTPYNISDKFNITATVEVIIDDAVSCYATVLVSDNAVSLNESESSTIYLGDMNVFDTVLLSWNFTAIKEGQVNFTVNSSCYSDNITFENLNTAKLTNITIYDQIPPSISLLNPSDGFETTNPARLIFSVTDQTGVENCSLFLNYAKNETIYYPSPGQNTFNLTLLPGEYNWSVFCIDNSSYHNNNSTPTWTFIIPVWQFYYGNLSSKISLSNSDNISTFTWNDQFTANIFIVETGSSISWNALQALGRNISNMSQYNDFSEADVNLSMAEFVDSINNSFTVNNMPKFTVSLSVYNKIIQNIPVVNSTNTTDFYTGILWDMSDGNTQYNGSQDLVFITHKNLSAHGKFGYYNYEVRVPATLKNYKLGSGTVTLYTEII
jgi:hypothetical protein